jgi:hypothetical protein
LSGLGELLEELLCPLAGEELARAVSPTLVELLAVLLREVEVGRGDVERRDVDRPDAGRLDDLPLVPRTGGGGEHGPRQLEPPERQRDGAIRLRRLLARAAVEAEGPRRPYGLLAVAAVEEPDGKVRQEAAVDDVVWPLVAVVEHVG